MWASLCQYFLVDAVIMLVCASVCSKPLPHTIVVDKAKRGMLGIVEIKRRPSTAQNRFRLRNIPCDNLNHLNTLSFTAFNSFSRMNYYPAMSYDIVL